MVMSNKELGLYLRNIRESLDYSTYDVNRLCNISQSYLSLMENGKRKPSAIILKKLAPIYHLNYIDLYEKAGYLDLAENEKISVSTHSPTPSCTINTEGLDAEDIKEINRYIEFIKDKKRGKK